MSEGTIILNKDSQATQTTAAALGINTDINTANVETENTLNIDRTLAHQQAIQRAAGDISDAVQTYSNRQQAEAALEAKAAEQALSQALEAKDNAAAAKAEAQLTAARERQASWSVGGKNQLVLNGVSTVATALLSGYSTMEAATLGASPLLHKTVGDIAKRAGWEDGSVEKVALHGFVGFLTAKGLGTNGMAGAASGAGSEWLGKCYRIT